MIRWVDKLGKIGKAQDGRERRQVEADPDGQMVCSRLAIAGGSIMLKHTHERMKSRVVLIQRGYRMRESV